MTTEQSLTDYWGNIDIYLFDQILKNRFDHRPRILDAGCGSGRNLVYFLRQGFEVFAVDESADAIASLQALAYELAPALPETNFLQNSIEEVPFSDSFFDAVICSAVLHFASDENQFLRMVDEMWRVLNRGGLFFARLASSIGLEERIHRLDGRRFRLPDGSDRFLVDQALLLDLTQRLGADQLEPIKTTNVQNLRCMTTWCLEKRSGRI